jgi:uncharacterized protein (DUF4415 family)
MANKTVSYTPEELKKMKAAGKSMTDWKRIDNTRDEDIDVSDIPEITEEQLKKAVLRKGLKPIENKHRVNIMLNPRIIKWFKEHAGGRGYQTLINQALEDAIDRETMEEMFRRIIREELRAGKKKAA